MKKLLIYITLLLLLVTTVCAADLTNDTGLQTKYYFDENNQSSPDSTGNGNTGTLNGYSFNNLQLLPNGSVNQPVLQTTSYGNAYNFSQNNSYLDTGIVYNFNNDSWTICTLIAPKITNYNSANVSYIFGAYPGMAPQFELKYDSNSLTGQVQFAIESRNSTNTLNLATGRLYPQGVYQHVCGVLDRSNNTQYIYVNGTLKGQGNIATGNISPATTTKIGFGFTGATTNAQLNAVAEYVRVWNRRLNVSEIIEDGNSYLFPIITDKIYASWEFESNFTNASGNYTYDTKNIGRGLINKSFNFDGMSNRISSSSSINVTSDWTSCLWAKRSTDRPTTGAMLINGGTAADGSTNRLRFHESSTTLTFVIYNTSGTGTSGGAITHSSSIDGIFHHYCAGVNQSTMWASFDGNVTSLGSILANPHQIQYFSIGKNQGSNIFWNGSIDNYERFNRSLTEEQVKTRYYAGLNSGRYNLFTINASNNFTNASLTNITAVVNGTTFTSTNSRVITWFNDTQVLNLTVNSTDSGGFITKSFTNYNTATDLNASLYQVIAGCQATEKFTNNIINGTCSTPGAVSGNPMYLQAGTYPVTFTNSSYTSQTNNYTYVALASYSSQFYNLTNGTIIIRSKDPTDDALVKPFTATILYGAVSETQTSDSDGVVTFNITTGLTYTVTANASNYITTTVTKATNSATTYLNVTYNTATQSSGGGGGSSGIPTAIESDYDRCLITFTPTEIFITPSKLSTSFSVFNDYTKAIESYAYVAPVKGYDEVSGRFGFDIDTQVINSKSSEKFTLRYYPPLLGEDSRDTTMAVVIQTAQCGQQTVPVHITTAAGSGWRTYLHAISEHFSSKIPTTDLSVLLVYGVVLFIVFGISAPSLTKSGRGVGAILGHVILLFAACAGIGFVAVIALRALL